MRLVKLSFFVQLVLTANVPSSLAYSCRKPQQLECLDPSNLPHLRFQLARQVPWFDDIIC